MTARDAGNPRAAAQRPSSVEDLNAVGFGSLTPQPAARQNVHGASDYRDGRWRVIFTRDLEPDDLSDAIIDPRATTVAALAVWDGANGDRDGRKAVSSWLALAFETPPVGPLDSWPFWLMLILALGGSGFVLWLGARQPATGAGWPASVLQPAPPTQDRSPSPVSAAGPDGDGAGRQPPAGGAASA